MATVLGLFFCWWSVLNSVHGCCLRTVLLLVVSTKVCMAAELGLSYLWSVLVWTVLLVVSVSDSTRRMAADLGLFLYWWSVLNNMHGC